MKKNRPPQKPRTEDGERIYAIGDIHGRLDLLLDLLAQIEAHNASLGPVDKTHVVFLGDMVDRGPNSKQVLELIKESQSTNPSIIALLGNHEDLMIRALAGQPGMMRAWLKVGGDTTLESFGVAVPDRNNLSPDFVAVAADAVPKGLISWMGGLPVSARSGDYFFCHAGLRPGVPLKRQSRSDMLWIREEFLKSDSYHGVVVVHGHSVETHVEIRENRIGIDSGAYCNGRLTALFLEGKDGKLMAAEEQIAT